MEYNVDGRTFAISTVHVSCLALVISNRLCHSLGPAETHVPARQSRTVFCNHALYPPHLVVAHAAGLTCDTLLRSHALLPRVFTSARTNECKSLHDGTIICMTGTQRRREKEI